MLIPLRPCNKTGCGRLTRDKYCPEHKPKVETRGSASSRGYTSKWRWASKAYLIDRPFCVSCAAKGFPHVMATVVDHRIPHRGDMALFWDKGNWQSMCKPCHDRKTATEDGGFGNRVPPHPIKFLLMLWGPRRGSCV